MKKRTSTWTPTISIGDDDLEEIEMAPENMSSPARDARIAQEQALAARASSALAAKSGMFSTRNLIIAAAVLGGAYYLYKRRG